MTKIITNEEHFEIDPSQSAPKAKQESKVDFQNPQANICKVSTNTFCHFINFVIVTLARQI